MIASRSVCVTTSKRSDLNALHNGAFGPRFLSLHRSSVGNGLLILTVLVCSACAAIKTQPPDIDLQKVHPSGAHRLAFAPSSRKLAGGGLQGRVRVWSVEDGTEILDLAQHEAPIRGLAWLDEKRLISADRSGGILLRELPSSRIISSTQLAAVADIALGPDRSWLLVIEGSRLHKLALPSLQALAQFDADSRLLSVAVSQSSGRVALSSIDRRVRLLDAELRNPRELPRPSGKALDLRFAPDDSILLAGSWFRLLVWDLQHRQLTERSTEHLGKVISVDISPDGERWLSLGRTTDSSFHLIDADSNQVLRRFQAHELCGWQGRFSPDGRYAASAAEDGSIHIYDLNRPYRPVVPYAEFDD